MFMEKIVIDDSGRKYMVTTSQATCWHTNKHTDRLVTTTLNKVQNPIEKRVLRIGIFLFWCFLNKLGHVKNATNQEHAFTFVGESPW